MAKKPRAAEVPYSPEIVQAILDHVIARGSVKSFCQKPGTPTEKSVYRWLRDNPDFQEGMAHAREMQADAFVDEMIDIADNEPDPQKARNRISARQWVAEKLKPKKYGSKMGVTHDGDVGLTVNIVRFTDD